MSLIRRVKASFLRQSSSLYFNTVWTGLTAPMVKIIFILSLYVLSICIVNGKPIIQRVKRSTDSPCLVLDHIRSTVSVTLLETAHNIVTRTQDLNENVKETRVKISGRLVPDTIGYLERLYFVNREASKINDENKQESVANSTAAMMKHYNQLYELVFHAKHIRTNGIINNSNSETKMRANLLSIERDIYSIICTIHIGLVSAGVDTSNTVKASVLSPKFVSYDGHHTHETYRAYVVMRDSERVLAYLNAMYTAVAVSLDNEM